MKRIFILTLALLLLLGGCTKPPPETEEPSARVTAEPTATPTPTPTPETPTPTPTPTPEPIINPLNGLPVEEDISDKRPYAVMISNIIYALPPCGISSADIIYEVLAEGGITRMMAIFSDIADAGALGSIRSVRPYYLELARSYDALIVHAGGSEQAYYDIPVKGIDNIDGVRGPYGEGTAFYRDPSRMANGYEHSLFTTSDLVEEYTGILNLPTEHKDKIDYGLRFSDEENSASKGESAANIQMKFAGYKTTDMKYNEADGVYYMTQYNQQYIDGSTWEPVDFTNVMVLFADTVTLADEYAHVDITLTGGGDGFFATGGRIVPIKWQRAGDGATFTYKMANGDPLILAPGRTFVGIVPNADVSGCTYS